MNRSCSTSTSTPRPAAGWARAIKPAGRRWWRVVWNISPRLPLDPLEQCPQPGAAMRIQHVDESNSPK